MAWVFLIGAVICEVCATLCLRVAATGRRRWFIGVVIGYVIAFSLLVNALARGMALGVAYGIWAAAGAALTAVLSRIMFKEPLTRVMALGILLIAAGVLLVELGASH